MKKLFLLLKTKDGKVLTSNFLSLSSLQLVIMLLPIITLPYVLRILGYEKYGLIALAASLVGYFQSVVDYSFKVTAVRDISVNGYSIKRRNIIYSRVMTTKAIFLLLSALIIGAILYIYPPFSNEKELFIYSILSLIGFALFPDWFFQGVEKMKYITIITIIIRVLSTISIFIFIKEKSDYIYYPLITNAGLIISGIVGQYLLYKKFSVKFILLPWKYIVKTMGNNFYIFINQFVPNLYNNSTSFLLGVLVSSEALGIYTAIIRIIDLCISLLNILSRVFFPLINRVRDTFNLYKKLMFTVTLVGISILILSNKIVFWYLGLVDPIALPVLIITGLSILGFVTYDIYGLNYFIVNRKDKLVMMNTIMCSIIAFLIAFPLISIYGIIGASLTLLFGRLLMGGSLMYKYIRYINA